MTCTVQAADPVSEKVPSSSGIGAQTGRPSAFRQGLDAALEELAVPRGRRHAALAQPGLHDLAGLGDVPDHRRAAPLALAGAPCLLAISPVWT